MELDEAIAILLELLRAGRAGSYGYDLYAREGAREAARRQQLPPGYDERVIIELSPLFYEAAWELCRCGIVRPGVRGANEQSVAEGGYSITIAGRAPELFPRFSLRAPARVDRFNAWLVSSRDVVDRTAGLRPMLAAVVAGKPVAGLH